jgi:hypothetical protein
MKLRATASLLVTAAVLTFSHSACESSGNEEPIGTPPPPSLGPDGGRPPPVEEEWIPANEPVPFPIPFQVGDKTLMMPTGSTLENVHSDPGGSFITIIRGQSKVVFDGDTGEILEWDVAAEDEEDFASLREG